MYYEEIIYGFWLPLWYLQTIHLQWPGLPNNSYKPVINTAWVRSRLCILQKRVHSTRDSKW